MSECATVPPLGAEYFKGQESPRRFDARGGLAEPALSAKACPAGILMQVPSGRHGVDPGNSRGNALALRRGAEVASRRARAASRTIINQEVTAGG